MRNSKTGRNAACSEHTRRVYCTLPNGRVSARIPDIIEHKMNEFQIITFYEFRQMPRREVLAQIRGRLRSLMRELSVKGTIILSDEGFNSTICGRPENVRHFIADAEKILRTRLDYKSSSHDRMPFRRIDVKIKPEIVTLKQDVDISQGENTHVGPREWNRIIRDPATLVLDTRNDYEFRTGTFERAVNPGTAKFSELPDFVACQLDPQTHKRVAIFCTGGIRCEKFAPYLKAFGFEEVYQLRGGILNYLKAIPTDDSLWEGECFVFDDRVTVDNSLIKGKRPDLSQHAE